METHDHFPMYLAWFGGSVLWIIVLYLFIKWLAYKSRRGPQPKSAPSDGQYRRKKGGRKRYR